MAAQLATSPTKVEIRHFHFFCGSGFGAKGFNRGEARVGSMQARFRCIGGIDVMPAAIRDFGQQAGVPGTVLDLFSEEQYRAFHGEAPPDGWRAATVDDIRKAAGGERPHIVFLSAPCKGFSGLLAENMSKTAKYQALNQLTLRGIWLMLEAWADDPPELIVFENVPRIMNRGRPLLDQIGGLMQGFGYAGAETTHDCGELGGLAQTRKRFLGVWRHMAKVPPYLYEPVKRRLRGVGEVLEKLPVPGMGDGAGGPMHRMPALQWRTWVRLAFVEAGSDWRSLNKLRVADGNLVDYGIAPDAGWHGGVLGVRSWSETSGLVTGRGSPTTGTFAVGDPRPFGDVAPEFKGLKVNRRAGAAAGTITTQRSPGSSAQSVADPRVDGHEKSIQLGVRRWDESASTVKTKMDVGQGPYAVSDPRLGGVRHNNVFRIVRFGDTSPAVAGPGGPGNGLAVADPRQAEGFRGAGKYRVTRHAEPAGTILAASTTGQGAFAVADPRYPWKSAHENKMRVVDFDARAGTVTGSDRVGSGAQSVADPRPLYTREGRKAYLTAGMYGVQRWEGTSGAVSAYGQHDNSPVSIADPRPALGDAVEGLPGADDRLVCVIRALDNTWHRPFTTLELAALQGLFDPDEHFELDGKSDSAWRERIGNAVPPPAAQAIASEMGRTLLLAKAGETFMLSATPIWVRPVVIGLMAATPFDGAA